MSEKNKFTNVAVVGLGYVGLPLCIRFCESGLKVIGLDVDQEKVDAINAGKSYIQHIDAGTISDLTSEHSLKASTNFSSGTISFFRALKQFFTIGKGLL